MIIGAAKKDFYIKPGYFDPDWSIRFLSQQEDEAKAAGFSGIRIIGDMTRALGDDADSGRLIEYEFKLRGMNEELAPGGSLGILGMHERALLLKGKLTIHSAPGQGTTVTVRIPTHADLRLGHGQDS